MPLKKFRLGKAKKSLIVVGSFIFGAATLGCGSYVVMNSTIGVNATEKQTNERRTGDYVFENIPKLNVRIDSQDDTSRKNISLRKGTGDISTLPAQYDSRAHGYVSRQENQSGEGLCWAYSFTTTAESYLLRKGVVSNAVEFSPKQLDYALAPASKAFSDSTINKYEDAVYALTGNHRDLADGSNFISAMYVTTGKYSLVEDNVFFDKMKLNDPNTLGDFNSYGDFITSRFSAYTTKQKAADVFDRNNAEYAITGVDIIDLDYYSSGSRSAEREEAINKIKQNIETYGAVAISSHYNEEKCMYKEGQNYTIIDRTANSTTSVCDDENGPTGHGMTLVGWKDDWAYKDGNADKTGAFILQNSYGNDGINYYFSYDSFATGVAITKMEKTDQFDEVFDISDYTKTVDADNYEVVFDFSSSESQKLTEIAAFVSPLTNNSALSWDIYAKSGNGQFTKVGKINDDVELGLHSIENLNTDLNGDFSIKIKYNTAGYTVIGLDPDSFAEDVAPYLTISAYTSLDQQSEDGRSGNITWVQSEEYIVGSDEDLIVKVDYPLELLESVTLDGEILNEAFYETTSGSTVLTIFSEYLDALELGEHVIGLNYSDGKTVNATFTVVEDIPVPDTSGVNGTKSPNTGEGIGVAKENTKSIAPVLGTVLVVLAISVVLGYTIYRGKSRVRFGRK